MANFKRYSRYTNGKTDKDRSLEDFIILRDPLQLEPGDDDIFVEIKQNLLNRPDLIAQIAYQNPDLWWVVLEFNNISDPLFELRSGQLLRLPNKERLLAAINLLGKK